MKFEIALIDDAPQDLNALRTALREACTARGDQAEIACYLNPGTALADAERGRLHANLVFVDVMMPEQSGTELIPALRDLLPQSCLFVLMSSNHGYIRAGYGVEAFDFLCKPILGPELREVLERAALQMERNYAVVTTRTRAYSFRSTMKELTLLLPERFLPCARGTLINITNVTAISHTEATLRGGLRVKISKQYFDAVYEAFNALN